MSIFGKKDSLEEENRKLRRLVSDSNKSSKNQNKMETRQIKLLNRQLEDYKRQDRERNKKEAVSNFKNLIRKLAAKPISKKDANEMMFGANALRNMSKPR